MHTPCPARGEIGIFNRSHYEDFVAARVRNLAPEPVWQRRTQRFREFERLLVDEGTMLVKVFLHVSADEQRKRLQERIDDPEKAWKFNPGDLLASEDEPVELPPLPGLLDVTSDERYSPRAVDLRLAPTAVRRGGAARSTWRPCAVSVRPIASDRGPQAVPRRGARRRSASSSRRSTRVPFLDQDWTERL